MAALFTAADIGGVGGLSENTSLLLVAFIGVSLLFVAYRYIRKAGIR